MPRRASLGTWLYFSCTALVFIFMSLRASTCRRARPSRPPRSAPAPHTRAAVLATVLSHARLADSLTPPSPPASHLRPPSPPLPHSRPAPRGKRHVTPAPSSMVARFVASSKPIAAGVAGAWAAAAAVGAATGKPAASSTPPLLEPHGRSTPPQPPERTPLSGSLPPRRTARSAARHSERPDPPLRHHHPFARGTRTAPPSPRHRPAHSTTRAAESRHSRLLASVTARHGHTTFHVSRLSLILALSCAFKNLKDKNTVWSISEQVPPFTFSITHPTRSCAARILVSNSCEAQSPRFKPSEREKNPSFTWFGLTNAQRTAMLPKHMQRYVAE